MNKSLSIANIIALAITIVINYLSNTGIFNGNTMSTVSKQYQNYFTPAGYAFSIWGLIYLGLTGFVIYLVRLAFNKQKKDPLSKRIGWWFVISCIANCLWVLAWLYEFTGMSVLIMLVLLFSLMKIIIRTNMQLQYLPFKPKLFVWWPFSIYAGWITVALIANIAAYLTKIQWSAFAISEITWTIIMIGIAGAINLFMTWNRNMVSFSLVGIWALTAVAVANWNHSKPVKQTALLVALILFINCVIHVFKNRKMFNFINQYENEF